MSKLIITLEMDVSKEELIRELSNHVVHMLEEGYNEGELVGEHNTGWWEHKYENDWIVTDPSCNQERQEISPTIFLFREDRIINPETKETERFELEIDLSDYTHERIFSDCESFGYSNDEVRTWIDKRNNNALIAECIFELEN